MFQQVGGARENGREDTCSAASPGAAAAMRTAAPAARQVALRAALLVSEELGVDVCALYASNRGPANVALGRQMAMYLAHVVCGQHQAGVGEAFGRDRTTVAHACMIIEERRDVPGFDRHMQTLEFRLLRLLARTDGTQ